ncbi:MAG TPA: heptaprenyl diphosphate synthase [Ruminococcaceae bacterium]|nr:heptaprenyl diphosphate synthase [Oscillospiraceae bacterium]
MKPAKIAELGVLCAVSLIMFIIELQIPYPFPIPGIKLGLANIITVYAVYHYKAFEVAALTAVRLLLGSIFSGNFAALVYSFSGSALCLLGMLVLKRIIDEKHLWLSSVFGAVLHNTGQIIAAVLMLQTPQVIVYYPFLLVSGCFAGAFTGLAAQLVSSGLSKIQNRK